MKDLDFDELDRAVNSLMTNVPKTAAPTPEEPKEKTLEISSTLPTGEKPSLDKLKEATAKVAAPSSVSSISTPVSRSTPAPAARRGGRFMDVVHPSADMKKPTVPPRSSVSRQGATITPSSISPRPVETSSLSPSKASTPAMSPSPRPVEVPERTAPKSDWPDPLEMANFKDDKDESDAKPSSMPKPVKASEVSAPKETEPASVNEPAPLVSPFLPDTKVDKRPLGGAPHSNENAESESTSTPDKEKDTEKLTTGDPQAQLPAKPEEITPELPEELQNDLMAIEADTTHQHATQSKDELAKPAKDEGAKTKETPSSKKEVWSMPHEDEKLLPAGPTSIPQQYREEPSTGDQENGAIYDTATYHQPLAHPAKKKSGWLWVLWIVIILVLGAGAGAALYFLGIV